MRHLITMRLGNPNNASPLSILFVTFSKNTSKFVHMIFPFIKLCWLPYDFFFVNSGCQTMIALYCISLYWWEIAHYQELNHLILCQHEVSTISWIESVWKWRMCLNKLAELAVLTALKPQCAWSYGQGCYISNLVAKLGSSISFNLNNNLHLANLEQTYLCDPTFCLEGNAPSYQQIKIGKKPYGFP